MPPKRQKKAWQDLLTSFQLRAIINAERRQQLRLQKVREIQAEINRLEAKGPNEGRAKQVRLLRRRIAKFVVAPRLLRR
jgi:hypothetical protein